MRMETGLGTMVELTIIDQLDRGWSKMYVDDVGETWGEIRNTGIVPMSEEEFRQLTD